MRSEKNERQVTFHPTNGRSRSSAAQSFDNEFRQHRDELEQEIGRIARELEEMRHVHATEKCEGEVTGDDYAGEQRPALPARIPVHYSRNGRSKRHISSTAINKEARDKPASTGAKNSKRNGCRRHQQVPYDQGGDSQLGCAEHSSEDYSVESDKTSVKDDDILDGSRQARGGHPRRTMHSQRYRRRTSHRRRFDNKGS